MAKISGSVGGSSRKDKDKDKERNSRSEGSIRGSVKNGTGKINRSTSGSTLQKPNDSRYNSTRVYGQQLQKPNRSRYNSANPYRPQVQTVNNSRERADFIRRVDSDRNRTTQQINDQAQQAKSQMSFGQRANTALDRIASGYQSARQRGEHLPVTASPAKYDQQAAANLRKESSLDKLVQQLAIAREQEPLKRARLQLQAEARDSEDSKYTPTGTAARFGAAVRSGRADAATIADVVYDYVNGDKPSAAALYDLSPRDFTRRYQRYSAVSDDDKAVFNYLYKTEGADAAMQYLDTSELQFDPLTAGVMAFGQPVMSAVEGTTKLVANSGLTNPGAVDMARVAEINRTQGEDAARAYLERRQPKNSFDEIYNTYTQDLASAQAQQPVAAAAGSIAANIAEMTMLATGMGALPGLKEIGGIARSILHGAGAMAGTHAINEAGALATGQITGEEYARDVVGAAIRGGVGSLGSYATGTISALGLQKLYDKVPGLETSKYGSMARLAANIVQGSGFDFAEALTHIGLDPDAYEDEAAFWEDMIIGFAFSAFDFMRDSGIKNDPYTHFRDINNAKTVEEVDAAYAKYRASFEEQGALDVPLDPTGPKGITIGKTLDAAAEAKKNHLTWQDTHKAASAYNKLRQAVSRQNKAEVAEMKAEIDADIERLGIDAASVGRAGEAAEAAETIRQITDSMAQEATSEEAAARPEAEARPESTLRPEETTGRADETVRPEETTGRLDETTNRPEETTNRSDETTIRPEETAIRPEETAQATRPTEAQEAARQRFDALPAEEQARIRQEADTLRDQIQQREDLLNLPKQYVERYGMTPEDIAGLRESLRTDRANLARLEEDYGLHLREGGERNDSTGAEGSAGQLEEGTGRNAQVGEPEGRPADRGVSEVVFDDRETSAEELGVTGGTGTSKVRVVKSGFSEDMQKAFRIAEEHGYDRDHVHMVSGDLSCMEGGEEVFGRGVRDQGHIYVNVHDPDFTPSQIVEHEVGHDMIDSGEIVVDRVFARVAELLGSKADVDAAVEEYASAYRGMSPETARDEMVCDARGKMNIFKYRNDASTAEMETIGELIRTAIQETAGRGSRMKKASTSSQYSLRAFEKDGVRYVEIDQNQSLFDGLSEKEMAKKAHDIIRARFAGKVIGLENKAYVNGRTADEYGHPSRFIAGDVREAKMRLSPELDNLLDAGRNFRTAEDGLDGHSHPDAVGGFSYFDAIFKLGNQYFEGTINILHNKKGALLKDITKIKNITQDIMSSYGKTPKSQFLRDVSMDRIAPGKEKSNTKNNKRQLSRRSPAEIKARDESYRKAAESGDTETAQRMVDEAAKEAMPDTKILDEDGNPLVVYHGTSEKFTVFDRTKGRANMDIQGMFFSPWDIDAGGYGENVGKYYLDIRNPASEAEGYKALRRFQGQNNAGVKAREYLISKGYDGVNNGNEEFIAFEPNQIKSADAVTYDDNGKVIPLSRRFDEGSPDIRFSRRADSEADRTKRAETQKKIDAEYSKTVDDILSGKKNVKDSVLVGYTPEIFRKLGMPDLPMAIGAGHVYSIAKTKAEAVKEGKYTKGVHYHGLGAETVKRINTACREPIAVIASKPQGQASSRDVHSVVAIIDIGTGGESRIVPVEITAERIMDGQRYDVNVYSSEYDKSVKGLMQEAIAQENIGEVGIYYAKKEAARLIGAGVQFPEQLQELMASDGMIHQLSEKVNLNVTDQTQTKQFARWFGDWQNAPESASKVVNADGTPKEMYHGSPDEGFTVFDPKKARAGLYGRGFYFTGDESAAAAYGATSSYYLDIKNPLSPGQHSITRQQMRKFLTEIKNNPDDYDFFNYGENARIGDVLSQVYGKGDFEALQDINATAIGDMKETIRLFNEVNGTKYDGLILPSETVVFDPTQIKSSTNNVGTFDKSNPDVNFSRRSTIETSRQETASLQQEVNRGLEQRVKDLQKDLEKQTERAKKWKRETRRTPEAEKNKVRAEDARRVARQITKDYGSKTKAADIAPEIQALSEYIRGGKGSASEIFQEGMTKAREIAGKVIDGAQELVEVEPEADTIKSLIGRTMYISEQDANDIPDFNHFRKTMRGKMKLVKGSSGFSVNEAYAELSELYPSYFPKEITGPSDQALRMAEVLDTIKPSLENPYSYDYALATEQVAQEIFAGVVAESNPLAQDSALRTNAPTFADKQQARYEQLIAQNKAKTAEQLARVREQRDAAIKRLKENHAETGARTRERRRQTELRAKIQKQTQEMQKTLLRPTDKKHFLQGMQPLVANALAAVNMESAFSYGPDGKHVPAGEGEATGRTKRFIELRKQLESHKEWLLEGTDLLESEGSLQKLIDMGDKPVSQMSSQELAVVHDALRDISAIVKNADKTFRIGKTESLSAAAESFRAENAGKKPVGEKMSAGARWMHRLMLDMETPENYFHRFGKTGDAIFRELRNAQDKQTMILKEAADYVAENIKVDPRKVAKNKVTLTLGGKEVKTTMANLMELYNLCRREQGLYHVLEGGVKFSDPKRFQAAAIRNVTPDELSAAFAKLPVEYKQAADLMQKYISGDLAKHGNEASMEVFGYEKFGREDYWQIVTDASDRRSDETQRQMNLQNTTVANWGSAKSLEPNANSAVVIGNVFDSFAESVSGMAGYAANLAVQQDINRLRNWKFYDADGRRTGTMKELIDLVHGPGGGQYLEKLMADVAGGMKAEQEYFGGLTGRYKGAAVAANMRVILQQPTAIARAAEMIGYRYLNAGLAMGTGKGWKKALQYAPIAQQKDWGSVDVNTGRTVKEILFKNTSPLARTNEALMKGAAKADAFGWGLLWNACEAETRAKAKDLKVGTKEYYQHVAERFTEIIDHTQVVDGILQRSQIMRNPSSLTKMATSFMGEPIKQFNQLSAAIYDARVAKTPGSKMHLAKTARAMLIAGTLNAVAQSIWDAVRDDDKTKDYLEKAESALFGIDGTEEAWTDYISKFMGSNMGDFLNPTGYIPYVKDVVSVLQGYDVERMDLAGISGFVTAAQRLVKAMNGEGKISTENALLGALGEGARLLGVPVANLKRDITAVTNTFANETGNYFLQYKLADFNYRQAGNKKEFMDILYNAYKNDPEAYEVIRADLIKRDELASSSQTTEEYINAQLRKRSEEDGSGIGALYDAQKAGNQDADELRETMLDSGLYTEEQIDKGMKAQYKEGGDLDALYQAYASGSKDFDAQYKALIDSGVYTEADLKREIENRMKEAQGVTSVKDLDQRFMLPDAKKAYDKASAEVQRTSAWKNATADERQKTEQILYEIASGTKKGQGYQEKIDGGRDVGITESEYVTFLLALRTADANSGQKTGSYSKTEIMAALESINGLSQKEKSYLFSTKQKDGNPYN